MEDANWGLIIVVVVVILINIIGLSMFRSRRSKNDRKRLKELKAQLEETRRELDIYKTQVNEHFTKTSVLFAEMTDSYKAVFKHLADGAQNLCSSDAVFLDAAAGRLAELANNTGKETTEQDEAGTAGEKLLPEAESESPAGQLPSAAGEEEKPADDDAGGEAAAAQQKEETPASAEQDMMPEEPKEVVPGQEDSSIPEEAEPGSESPASQLSSAESEEEKPAGEKEMEEEEETPDAANQEVIQDEPQAEASGQGKKTVSGEAQEGSVLTPEKNTGEDEAVEQVSAESEQEPDDRELRQDDAEQGAEEREDISTAEMPKKKDL